MMRQLTSDEISKLASAAGVKRIAVENFLSTMGDNAIYAGMNLNDDARCYRWNAATQSAIRRGIVQAGRPVKVTK